MNAKTTATELSKATNDQKSATPAVTTTTPQTVAPASPSAAGPIKTSATPISSTQTTDATANEGRSDASVSPPVKAEKKSKAPTKMEIASVIYLRMSKQKDVTRKQIVEQFVLEAKLSAAGASTYYQLIKAKLG
ncbi:hypothetical protein FHW83_003991 [Duganella sp. SG902]|uniref:hypothetical protein n=1 Tax=Duganella sp. SG902 TaxID=2587016 RepID=UPI00159E9B37|nr:hypothetical protein [Duganella sp. SG902]NVM78167.1 hypothetical protein [Duganella sp. SG902]